VRTLGGGTRGANYEEADLSLTTLSARLSQRAQTYPEGSLRRAFYRWRSEVVFDLDMLLSGLAGANRRIRADQNRRRNQPRKFSSLEYGEG
jgi:hypothetical protein